jgi:hypothetical protein
MSAAALKYLPIQALPRPADARPQPRRKHHNPTSTRLSTCFSRYPSVQTKPRQGVKNWTPQNAPGLSPKTHANPPGITLVAEQAVVGCSVAAERAGGRAVSLIERVETPNPLTGAGYGVNNPPVRIAGDWSSSDIYNALYGRSPRGLGSPHLHHAGQMPGAGIHEVLPGNHLGNSALHPNAWNQGVTRSMRTQDANLHWWYRAREQGADTMFPNHIYD